MFDISDVKLTMPVLVESMKMTPEKLTWLGSENLLIAQKEWQAELDERASKLDVDSRRKDRPKTANFAMLTEACTAARRVVDAIGVALVGCEWKPLFPIYREPNHFTESTTAWVFDDQAETPRFGPAHVIDVDEANYRVKLKLYDSGDFGFWTDIRGCNLFTLEEFGYLVNHPDYADALLQSSCDSLLDVFIILAMIRAGKERFDSFALS